MRQTRLAILLLIVLLVASGCVFRPPDFAISDVSFDWSGALGEMTGYIANTGGRTARYVELGVKLTAVDDPNVIYDTGWTNFANFAPGEKRRFRVFFTQRPPGVYRYTWRWSTTVGGAMY